MERVQAQGSQAHRHTLIVQLTVQHGGLSEEEGKLSLEAQCVAHASSDATDENSLLCRQSRAALNGLCYILQCTHLLCTTITAITIGTVGITASINITVITIVLVHHHHIGMELGISEQRLHMELIGRTPTVPLDGLFALLCNVLDHGTGQ